jgi:hypothetical protein
LLDVVDVEEAVVLVVLGVVEQRHAAVSWVDHQRKARGRPPSTREYGTASSKQAAIRLAA